MTEQQYKRASKVVFTVIAIVFGYVALSMLAWLAANKNASSWRTMLQMIAAILVIVVSAIAHFTMSGTRRGARIMEISMAVGYAVLSLLNTTPGTYAYALPMLVATLAYLDYRFTIEGSVLVIAVNVIRLIIHFDMDNQQALAEYVLAILVLSLTAYVSVKVTKLLLQFNKENLGGLEKAAKLQEESNQKMILVAENVMKHFDNAMEMLDNLDESIQVSHTSINDIAESTESC